jgi:ElaB/YqjD/DUF883 family membrane-anchored ribosome-binding protein
MADETTFTKADLDAAIEEALAPIKKKNGELMDELKAAKRGKQVDPAEVERLQDQVDDLTSKLAAQAKTAKEAATAREKAENALKTEQGFTHKLLVENGLREQLVAAGVTHPAHQKGAIAMLASQVAVAADGETRVAKVGDKALADFVKEWAGTDEGKAFVSAPNNSGGGAGGSDGKGATGKTMTRAAYSALSQNEKSALGEQMAKGDLKLTDA